jgi:hypothetical protein
MPSNALQKWLGLRSASLDEIEDAHRAVGGAGPGRRTATMQINCAYAVLLSSQFQGFCRDLHEEAMDHLLATSVLPPLQILVRMNIQFGRKMDRGNPNSGNLGSDFGRLGLNFWPQLDAHRVQNRHRRILLEELNEWRNAIAHQDFAGAMLKSGRVTLHLAQVQSWRKACDGLARSFDEVLRIHLHSLIGTYPW